MISPRDCDHPESALQPLPYSGTAPNPEEWECGRCGEWQIAKPTESETITDEAHEFDLDAFSEILRQLPPLPPMITTATTAQPAKSISWMPVSSEGLEDMAGWRAGVSALQRLEYDTLRRIRSGAFDFAVATGASVEEVLENMRKISQSVQTSERLRWEVSPQLHQDLMRYRPPGSWLTFRAPKDQPIETQLYGVPLVVSHTAPPMTAKLINDRPRPEWVMFP